MPTSKFELFKGKNNQFYFRLRATNGKVVLASEGYTTKANCMNGIESVKKNARETRYFQNKEARDGQYYFLLMAPNGQAIGNSEMYTTEGARDSGIGAVQRAAVEATVEEMTD